MRVLVIINALHHIVQNGHASMFPKSPSYFDPVNPMISTLPSGTQLSRDMWSFRYLETLAQDLRFGLRMMSKNPGFTAVAVLTLALGIGANTAMFSSVDAVLIRPLPYLDAGRLVMIWDDTGQIGESKFFSTPAEWHEWRRDNTVFTDIAATQPGNVTLSSVGEPEELPGRKVTANLWTVLGA